MKAFLILFVLMLAIAGLTQAPPAAQKPLDKDQVMALVSAGMDNAQLAKKVEDLGINFEPSDDYLLALRKAGAQDVLIYALRAAKPKAMNQQQVLALVAGGVPSERATALVKQHGIDFVPDDKYVETLRVAGADETLIAAVREASEAIPGGLEVTTSPNAEVYLDGTLAGRADSAGKLAVNKVKPGAHTLRVSLATKKDSEQAVSVKPGATTKAALPLTDQPGRILVTSVAGAEIYVDGTSRGKTGADGKLALADVAPGSHKLRVTAQGKKDFERSVSTSAGQESVIQARLEDLPGKIRVRATPGAKVSCDDKYPVVVATNAEVTFELPAGLHSVHVMAEGQPEFVRAVTVTSGQVATLDAPRADAAKPFNGKGTDGLYRTVTATDGLWYYYRFFPDGTVVWANSAGSGPESVASVEREIAVWHDSKNDTHAYVYRMQGSTIRFSIDDPFGPPIDHVGKIRGDTLTLETWKNGTRQGEDTYRLVGSESATAHRKRH